MAAQGLDVAIFTVEEPDFDTPDNVAQAGHRAIQAGRTRSTPAAGTPELRRAVAEKLSTENGIDCEPDQVLVSNGARQALYMMMLCLVDQGDQVLLPAPYRAGYAAQARACGAEVVPVDTTGEDGCKLTPEALRMAVTDRSKLLIINSPNNPTGTVLTEGELRDIVEVALEHDLWILSDETYEKFIYDPLEHASPAAFGERAPERLVTVNGVSRTYAMGGWRIGYAAGPPEVIEAATNLQGNLTGGPNSIAQHAALEALTGSQESVEEMRETFAGRRRVLVGGLNEIAGLSCPVPQGAFYAFPDFSRLIGKSCGGRELTDDAELCSALLEEVQVAVVPGSAFGAPGYLRFSYAIDEASIEKGLERLERFVEMCQS